MTHRSKLILDAWTNDQGQRLLRGDQVIAITKSKYAGWKTTVGIFLGYRERNGKVTSVSLRVPKKKYHYVDQHGNRLAKDWWKDRNNIIRTRVAVDYEGSRAFTNLKVYRIS